MLLLATPLPLSFALKVLRAAPLVKATRRTVDRVPEAAGENAKVKEQLLERFRLLPEHESVVVENSVELLVIVLTVIKDLPWFTILKFLLAALPTVTLPKLLDAGFSLIAAACAFLAVPADKRPKIPATAHNPNANFFNAFIMIPLPRLGSLITSPTCEIATGNYKSGGPGDKVTGVTKPRKNIWHLST